MSVTELVHSLTHIVGGTPVQQGRFQFQAGILQNGFQFCGGTLIAPNVVMTAAHCAEVTATDVVLGCEDINDLSQCEVIPVVDSSVFENFDIESFVQGDIQLLVLESDSVQQPITLAAPGFDLNPGQDLTVIGWGAVDFSTQQSSGGILLEALVESTSQESCNQQYKDLFGFMFPEILDDYPGEIINDFKMCSLGDSKGGCQGDSGGPIFMRCDATGEDVQLGIVSFGLGCAYDGMPTVYTTVFHPDGFKFIENVVTNQGHSLKTIGSTAEFCVVGGTQPPEQLSDPPTPFPTFDLAAWTCSNNFFSAGDGCHCNCGIPDPDCEYDTLKVFNCQPGQTCVEGVCFGDENQTFSPTPDNGVPPEWFCPQEFFADSICDCNCGAPDPDCAVVTNIVVGCDAGEKCIDDVCVPEPTSFPSNSTSSPSVSLTFSPTFSPTPDKVVPPEWFCPQDFFADLICDCNCGAPDPDCEPGVEVITNIVFGCDAGEKCIDDVCVPEPTSFPSNSTSSPSVSPTFSPTVSPTVSPTPDNGVPPEWICTQEFFADLICDCNCGAPDPDCEPGVEVITNTVFGCDAGEKCIDDVCVPEPTSFPSNSTSSPTVAPTASPTVSPTVSPIVSTTLSPTASPTISTTDSPTVSPTTSPNSTSDDSDDDDSFQDFLDDLFGSSTSIMAALIVLLVTITLVVIAYFKCCRKESTGVEPDIEKEVEAKELYGGPITETML